MLLNPSGSHTPGLSSDITSIHSTEVSLPHGIYVPVSAETDILISLTTSLGSSSLQLTARKTVTKRSGIKQFVHIHKKSLQALSGYSVYNEKTWADHATSLLKVVGNLWCGCDSGSPRKHERTTMPSLASVWKFPTFSTTEISITLLLSFNMRSESSWSACENSHFKDILRRCVWKL